MSYSRLRSTNLPAMEILQFCIQRVLHSIYRKLSFKQRFKNPWIMEVSEPLPRQVFYQCFRAVQSHSTEFGRSLHIKRDRAGNAISQKISYTHLGTFKYHKKSGKRINLLVNWPKLQFQKKNLLRITSFNKLP